MRYYGNRGNGSSLKHYRTKGSRNGYSKDPNYRPTGQRATGRLVNGRYVYDDPYLSSYGKLKKAGVNDAVRSMDNGAKNNWQQQANETSATNRMLNEHMQKRTANVIMPVNNITTKAMEKHNIFKKGWDGAVDNSYANASARVAAGNRVSTPQRTQVASAKSKRDKAIARGAANNWQQQAAANRNMYETSGRIKSGASKSGNMSVDGFDFNVSNRGKTITDYSTARAHQNAVNQANAEARARNAIANRGSSGTRKITKQLKSHGSPNVSKEYQEELAYNSKQNVYPSQQAFAEQARKNQQTFAEQARKNQQAFEAESKAKYEKFKNESEAAYNKAKAKSKSLRADDLTNAVGDRLVNLVSDPDKAKKFLKSKTRDSVVKEAARDVQNSIRTASPYKKEINVGGAMRNDPRYSSSSVVGTVYGNTNKQRLAEIGSDIKGAYNKVSHPIETKVNKAKGEIKRTTREVKKAASSAVASGKKTVDDILNKFKKKKK